MLANTKKLIEQHKVAALIGYTSGAGVEASLSYLDGQNVALIGPVTGNMGIRAQHHKFLFHTRAGYSEEMQRMIGALANTGIKRFAIAYLDDVGPANPQAMKAALTQNNLTAVVEVPMKRNADNFSEQVANLVKSTPMPWCSSAMPSPLCRSCGACAPPAMVASSRPARFRAWASSTISKTLAAA